MRPPSRLRLEPRPSRIACVGIAAGCVALVTLTVFLPLDGWAKAVALLVVGGVAARGFWRCTGRGVPALVHVGLDRRITTSLRDGRSHDGIVLDDSYVGEWLTTIVWRRDSASHFALAESILILPDTLPAEDFRRLRVLLRYGRAVIDEGTSGRYAG
jgi:membrane-bound toxin of toxin-antitoxin system